MDITCKKLSVENTGVQLLKMDGDDKYPTDECVDNSSPPLLDNAERSPLPMTNKNKESRAVLRNLGLVGLVWFAVFTPYNALEILQSSLNPRLGVISISIIYVCKIFTSLLGPLIVTKLTPKWTIFAGCLCHAVFILANFHPVWYTLLPAGVLVGVAMGPLWVCLGVYITTLGVQYSKITGQPKAGVLSKFNGILQASIPLTFLVGNLLSSLVLQNVKFSDNSSEPENSTDISASYSVQYHHESLFTASNYPPNNQTFIINTTFTDSGTTYPTDILQASVCGPNFCPSFGQNNNSSSESSSLTDKRPLYVLLCIFGSFNLCGTLVSLFGLMNPSQETSQPKSSKGEDKNICRKVCDYLGCLFDWRFLLLTPCIVYMHLVLALTSATFPKAYITCTIGISMVGYISMARGITGVITNSSSGIIGQYIHRNFLFAAAFILTIVQSCMWLLWESIANQLVALFFMAALAGVSNGLNLIQFSAFLGTAFTDRKTEAFSFYHFWAGIAVAFGFLQNNYICAKYQIYILLCIMVLAVITFTIFSIYLHKHEAEGAVAEVVVVEDDEKNDNMAEQHCDSNMKWRSHEQISCTKMKTNELQILSASNVSLTLV